MRAVYRLFYAGRDDLSDNSKLNITDENKVYFIKMLRTFSKELFLELGIDTGVLVETLIDTNPHEEPQKHDLIKSIIKVCGLKYTFEYVNKIMDECKKED